MSGDIAAHSFDRPRERPAPASARARRLDGAPVDIIFDRPTLVVAVKANCDGCRDFIFGPLEELADLVVLVVSAAADGAEQWAGSARPVLIGPELLEALDVRSPPFYALVMPSGPRVVAEGAAFSSAQVASEVAAFLD